MCAVVGIFQPIRATVPDMDILRLMAQELRHRGPDGEGFHAETHIALGHRRLAIVDLSGGAQPMATEDNAVVISFNGEIFNHVDLRRQLQAEGHRFRTRSDTETILCGWRHWGLGVLGRLRGQFAFALWDRAKGHLLLARDPLGEKPMLYATLADGTLAFASELAGLLALPGLPRQLDASAVDDFMAFGYIPDPKTIYVGIRRLPAAHYMLLRVGDAVTPVPQRYWHPPIVAQTAETDVAGELRRRLDDAVQSQLMADVPLGAFLSGGTDSSAVVALASHAAKRSGGGPLATFTIGFEGEEDERPAAAALAKRLGTSHTAVGGTMDYLTAAREMARIFGEPFGDHSAVPTLAVCRLARRHVTVALSGDGGDEIFGGYRRYRWHMLVDAVRTRLPASVRRQVIGRLAGIYPKLDRAPRWLRAKHTLTELSLDAALGYYSTVCKSQDRQRRGLFSRSQRLDVDGHQPAERIAALMAECDPDDALLQAQYADLHTYLPGNILVKADRTSMAVSLEMRPPMLDRDLVVWGMALPAHEKLRNGIGKHVLRRAMASDLPSALLWSKKRGFADRIGGQFRTNSASVKSRLLGDAMRDSHLFDADALTRLADEHASGSADHTQTLWQLLVFEGFLNQPAVSFATPPLAGARA